ncbi:hypothetical protein B0A48_15011 [Cryoendolithus antarcticus]|uniref:Heterokaryon incompatibility domain-containing protein n=1 Tax=Cryoendolithus antarcticus TaxID=1507870 RepID=A0A1V8SJ53_9PEZI|nr:hypothetical protein B0A48_15011 [Cryoendolithus antarcticus]
MYRLLDHPRKEIRLLVVQPGKENELLRAAFDYALLDFPERPQYETISYVWGDCTERSDVDLGGTIFSIPLSSVTALQCIRHPDRERVVWIDAVCINQTDDGERGRQVAMMADIYMCGSCNLAVLSGHKLDRGRLAASAIAKIREHVFEKFGSAEQFDVLWMNAVPGKLEELRTDITQDSVDAVCGLLDATWFRRLWVMQEVALPSRTIVHFEGAQIDLLHIRQMISCLSLDPYQDRDVCEKIVNVTNLANLQMDELLDTALFFDVTEKRDTVYGMLGLFWRARDLPELPLPLVPDYTKDPSAVLRDATRFAIESQLYMGVLPPDEILTVKGLALDAVYALTRKNHDVKPDQQWRDFLDSAVALSTQPPYASPTSLRDLESTLVAGVHADAHGDTPLETLLAFIHDEQDAAQPTAYISDVYSYQHHRCFFMTDTGRMDLGPD